MTTWTIFTDLDESLLDRETYSWTPAAPALEAVRRRKLPVIFCTSKTAAEVLYLQERMGVEGPAIVESGGGILVPKGYFARLPQPAADQGTHELIALSALYDEVLRGLGHLKEFTANSIRGFDDMTVEEIARATGLPEEVATLAKQRQFDEPFRFTRREAEFAAHLTRVAHEVGLRVTRGGRFYHLHGDTDKGRAVHMLKSLLKSKHGAIRTIGLGDSELDLPMLAETDKAVLIPRRDGSVDAALAAGIPGASRAAAAGPHGWNQAVLELLESC